VPQPEPARETSTHGTVMTSTASPGRRIFIDGRTAGETPAPVVVSCGTHRVRIGSAGRTSTVEVPCGGEVLVTDR
jgi:serine/threonine-protein kinase